VGEYSVEVKPTARKELEALPDTTLARVVSPAKRTGPIHMEWIGPRKCAT
jgi:mRNA-degrading endonuclease RelE of RelBE toxin-antitoxin system